MRTSFMRLYLFDLRTNFSRAFALLQDKTGFLFLFAIDRNKKSMNLDRWIA